MVKKAVKISEEEKKAISKAKYEAEMAKNRAGAALLTAEREETMKELKASGSDDEKNLEELAARDGEDSKDSNSKKHMISNPAMQSATGIGGSTGATGASLTKKQKLLEEIKTGDLADAIANAKNPELRIALEAKQQEQIEEKKESGAMVPTASDNSNSKKKETQHPRGDVQLDGADGAHNGLGRPSLEDAGNVPSTEDYAAKMYTDDPNGAWDIRKV